MTKEQNYKDKIIWFLPLKSIQFSPQTHLGTSIVLLK